MKNILLSALTAITLFCSSAMAGPFGTNMGDDLLMFNDFVQIEEDFYVTAKVPAPTPEFNAYFLDFYEGKLCGISAVASKPEMQESGFPETARSVKKLIEEIYGKPSVDHMEDFEARIKKGLDGFKKDLHQAEHKALTLCMWQMKDRHDHLENVEIYLVSTGEKTCMLMLGCKYANFFEREKKKNAQ